MMSAIARLRNGATRVRLMLLTATIALLAACAGGPESEQRTVRAEPAMTVEQLSMLARDALPADRPRYQLEAAALLLDQNKPDEAQTWLQQAGAGALTVPQRGKYQELQARLALMRGKPKQALALLQDSRLLQTLDQLSPEQQTALALVKAEALAANRDYLGSARERVFIDALLDGAERERNQAELWRALQSLDTATLTQARTKAGSDPSNSSEEWRGWLELALVYKQNPGNPTALNAGIEQWKQQWRVHPARAQLKAAAPAKAIAAAPIAQPGQIALLLPITGKLAGFGTAVRDGFMAAWYDARAKGSVPAVRLYDTNATPNFIEIYQRAVADGAQMVIGPLEKSQVAALYPLTLSVPTLALNRADLGTPPPAQLYQFSLAPEDEAEEVARMANQRNARRALIVAPEDERRARELQAFSARWQQLGGEVVASAYYPTPQLLSQSIRNALNIPQGEARKREIETLLGRKVEYVPHRRGDIDMVFVLARPQQARSIVPTLAYHYAGDIPTYAVSRSYGGVDAPGQDRDIEGLRFTEIPWLLDAQQPLKQQIVTSMPQSRAYLRLYALGVDSFRLLPQLRQLETQPGNRVDGVTGALTLSPDRIVQRELALAQIRDGLARPYDENARTTPIATPDTDSNGGTESPIDATQIPEESD